jgi:response regulator of citrate/malate metabolism
MKTTKIKIEKALKHFENTDFSIREVVEKSGVSYPTIRNYLSNLPIREVSYGRYEIINNTAATNVSVSDTPLKKKTSSKKLDKSLNESNTKEIPKEIDQADLNEVKEIYGELYVAAYLKGFDRGFELGIQNSTKN